MWVNLSVEKFTGYSAEEYLNLPDRFKQIHGDDDRVRALTNIENGLLQYQSVNDVEVQIRHKDGSLKWVSVSYQPMYTEKGEYLGLRSSIRDITERKQLSDQLKRMLDANQSVIFSCRPSGDFSTTFVSENIITQMGYTPEEFIAPGFWAGNIHPEDAPRVFAGLSNISEKEQHVHEYRFRHKDGSWHWMHDESTLIRDKSSNPVEIIGYWSDITERKRDEALLRESEKRFKDIFEFANDGILIADSQTRKFHGANRALCRMLGYSLEELKNMGVENIHPAEDLPFGFEHFDKISRGDGCYAIEIRVKRKDGVVFYADVSAYPLIFDGKQCIAGVFRDLTELKLNEAALHESEARSRAFADSSPNSIIVTDINGKIFYWNKTVEKIYGYSAEEIAGKSIEFLWPEAKRSVDRKDRKILFKDLQTDYLGKTVETSGAKKDGTEITVYISTSCWEVDGQKFFGLIVQDISERKHIERELEKAHAELEIKVSQRTAELEDVNKALKVLLKRNQEDKLEMEENILFNVKELVVSYLDKLKKSKLDAHQKTYINILESNLNNIISPFGQRLSAKHAGLTTTEIHIADLIKEGKTTKEIAELLNLSSRTIDFHRNNIRKKIGISNKKANLKSLLSSLQ